MTPPQYNPNDYPIGSNNHNYKSNNNYSSNGKKGLGQRIKNFFHVDIEKDLQEEEGTKVFQRTKLFDLNRYNLFIFLALFFVIVNVLVGFDLNFLYIRQILGFLFLILIPGLLIMLCFKIRSVGFWEYLVYTIGLSVAFIMFAGLAVNWTLPLLNITDKPLSLYPILICFDIFLIILGFVAWKRNKDLIHEFTTPKLDALNNIFFIIPMFFPVLSILGAFLLNNHGPNILTMIMLGAIAVYVLLLVIFRKRLNENIWPWAILMISMSLLLSSSLRSWYVSGVDTNLEYSIFQINKLNHLWVIRSVNNTYNAMLSVSILPLIFDLFIKINSQYIYKLFLTIIFSFSPLIVYAIAKRYFNCIVALSGGLFFIFQTGFLNWASIPIRQEIAYIFFGLMLLVLFTKQLNPTLKKVLFVLFGTSMIVSHYSTAYIALALFTLTYIFISIYKINESRKIKKGKLHLSQKSEVYLTGVLIILLLLFGFLWYSQVTPTANGLIDFTGKTISNLGNMFNKDVQVEGSSFMDQFSIIPKRINVNQLISEYQIDSNLTSNSEKINPSYLSIYPRYPPGINGLLDGSIGTALIQFRELLKTLGKLFIILGSIIIYFKLKKVNILFRILILISLALLILLLILPFFSVDYDVLRTYQQFLFILSSVSVIGTIFIFKIISKKYYFILTCLFILLYLFMIYGLPYQIIGGTEASLNINNQGLDYSSIYVLKPELESIKWIKVEKIDSLFNMDGRADTRFYLILPEFRNKIIKDVYPSLIAKDNYVYLKYNNVIFSTAYKRVRQNPISFNFPTEFIDENKNKIYNNGDSEIYK